MHCMNTTFIYHDDVSKYRKKKRATYENVFDFLFDIGAWKFLSEKEKRYLHELFERWDQEHLQLDEVFNDVLDIDGLEDINRDEGMQNLNIDD